MTRILTDPAGVDPDNPTGPSGGGGGGGTGSNTSFLSGVPYGPASHSTVSAPRFALDDPGPGLHVLLYDAAGYRKYLPAWKRWGASWELNRYGGFGQGSLTAAALGSISAGDRVDVYIDGFHHYRGYVAERDLASDMPSSTGATLYGRSTLLAGITVRSRLVYPVAVDASTAAAALWSAWGAPVYPWTTTDFPTTGIPVAGVLDYAGKSLTDAMNALAQACGDSACWGCDIDGDGVDRIYFRSIGDLTATDFSLPAPARNVGKIRATDSIADRYNIVTVVGGDLGDYANKIVNGGFEKPVAGGFGIGSLVQNDSFESGSHQSGTGTGLRDPEGNGGDNDAGSTGHGYTDFWHLFGGASTKQNGEDSDGSEAQDGEWWIETDDLGEGFSQVFRLPAGSRGNDLGVSFYLHPEEDDAGAQAQVKLSYRDATSHTWTDDPTTGSGTNPFTTIEPKWQAWEPYSHVFKPGAATANADMVKITVTQTTTASIGGGLRWDNFTVWDNSKRYQSDWQTWTNGTGVISAVDEAYTEDRVEGGYCLRLTTSSVGGVGDEAVLTNRPQSANDTGAACLYGHTVLLLPVLGSQTLRFSSYVKAGPAAVSGQQLVMELVWYESDKATICGGPTLLTLDTSTTSAADWLYMQMVRTAPSNAAFVYADLKPMNHPGDWLIDGVSLRDVRAPWGPTRSYQPDGSYTETFRAAALFSDTSDDPREVVAAESEAAFGPRETTINADILNINDITNIALLAAQAEQIAANYLYSAAAPTLRVPVPFSGRPDLLFWPGSSARLVGTNGEAMRPESPLPPGLPIDAVRAEVSDAGLLTRTVQLGKPEVTTDALIMQTAVAVARSGNIAAPQSGGA